LFFSGYVYVATSDCFCVCVLQRECKHRWKRLMPTDAPKTGSKCIFV